MVSIVPGGTWVLRCFSVRPEGEPRLLGFQGTRLRHQCDLWQVERYRPQQGLSLSRGDRLRRIDRILRLQALRTQLRSAGKLHFNADPRTQRGKDRGSGVPDADRSPQSRHAGFRRHGRKRRGLHSGRRFPDANGLTLQR